VKKTKRKNPGPVGDEIEGTFSWSRKQLKKESRNRRAWENQRCDGAPWGECRSWKGGGRVGTWEVNSKSVLGEGLGSTGTTANGTLHDVDKSKKFSGEGEGEAENGPPPVSEGSKGRQTLKIRKGERGIENRRGAGRGKLKGRGGADVREQVIG